MVAWLTPEEVAEVGDIEGDVGDNTALTRATAGAVAFVERERADLLVGDPAVFTPGDDVIQGAAMLAARLYERRGALLGIAPSAGYEAAAQILRYDPDIEQLLQIGRSRPFGFGAPPLEVVEEEA